MDKVFQFRGFAGVDVDDNECVLFSSETPPFLVFFYLIHGFTAVRLVQL